MKDYQNTISLLSETHRKKLQGIARLFEDAETALKKSEHLDAKLNIHRDEINILEQKDIKDSRWFIVGILLTFIAIIVAIITYFKP